MNKTLIFALTAGLSFGIWPIIMQRSGLNGYMQAFIFSVTLMLMTSVPAMTDYGEVKSVKWSLAIIASVIAGFGTMFYTSSIARAFSMKQSLAMVILAQILVQTMVPVIIEAVQTKSIGMQRVIGCMLAITSLVFLTRK